MAKPFTLTKHFWHFSVCPIHQCVAVAAYLQSARRANAPVYYAVNESTEVRIQQLAAMIDTPVHAAFHGSDGRLIIPSRRGWWWMGTHDRPDGCPTAWTWNNPPDVSLCLFLSDRRSLPLLSRNHIPYITNQWI